jgi:Putative zinc-finger
VSAESCREWRESLAAHALGQLPEDERVALKAHVEGCAACRAELESLTGVARLLPLADPEHVDSAPAPPPSLADRVIATVRGERRAQRRRKLRLSLALSGATAALAAAILALVVLPGGGTNDAPEQHVTFGAAPAGAPMPSGMKITATLIPHSYGTEIHMYVKGAPSGALCRVFLRGPHGERMPAGTFRYRWGEDSDAVLSAAMDLSRTRTIGVRVGSRTFIAPTGSGAAT